MPKLIWLLSGSLCLALAAGTPLVASGSGEEVGACCGDDGVCRILTQQECIDEGSNYQGDGTDCNPDPCTKPGACCIGIECQILVEVDCLDANGVFQGEDTVCDPNPCVPLGACCFENDGCVVTSRDACESSDGSYQGDDVSCDPNPCAPTPTTKYTWGRIKSVYR